MTLFTFFVGGVVGGARAEMIQLTDLPNTRSASAPSISADARFITFASNGNIGGLNPTPIGNVFIYEVLKRTFTRVTADGGSDPTINADGKWVAFTSSADYARRNADGSDEIFRYDRVYRRFYQVTFDRLGDGASALPVITGSGKWVAFESTSNIALRNPDLSNEVFLFKGVGNVPLSRDPAGDGESHSPAVSSNGKVVAFQSTSDLVGRNADLSQELMLYDVAKRRLTQATNDVDGTGASGSPSLTGDGGLVAFISSSNVGGLNPDGASALYVMNRPLRAFTLVTRTLDGAFDADTPTITDDGRWIAFVTSFDVTRGNPDHNPEIVIYDRLRKTFTQVTDSAGCANSNPKFSADGTRIAFLSQCDLAGGNADHSLEIFLADNPLSNLVLHSEGPVSIGVVDPNGFTTNSNLNFISRASYERGDFNGNGQPETRVTIPQAVEGPYFITLTPDANAASTDAVGVDVSLNGITASMASDTVGNLSAQTLLYDNQGFFRRSAHIAPASGVGSVARLITRLPHGPAAAGAVTLRFTDGTGEASFDLGRIENYSGVGPTKVFKRVANGFTITMKVTRQLDGTTGVNFVARNGDLSMFAGPTDVSMTMVVQIGPDTSMYHWRFRRLRSGALELTVAPLR